MFSLLTYTTDNIGDDVQSLAARRFLPKVSSYIDRDQLSGIPRAVVPRDKDFKTNMIMNGWFLHKKGRSLDWPPPDYINPLFVSFHIDNKEIVEKHVGYFKKHEPIGCRDHQTVELLESHGIKAYFSGCLTLTLKKSITGTKNEGVLFVDPFGHDGNFQFPYPGDHDFPSSYWEKIPNRVRSTSTFISNCFKWDFGRPSHRLSIAKMYLSRLEQSKLVVTSRVHTVLPCLALEVPVLLVLNSHTENDPRVTWIKRICNSMTLDEFADRCDTYNFDVPISNPSAYKELVPALKQTCLNFVNSCLDR